MKYKVLSIAGFDGSGGAGIQADLKTFTALGCYGMTVLTALPIQNTVGVRKCYPISAQCVEEQLQAIFDDIPPDAIKIGMLFSAEIVRTVASFLRNVSVPIVLDPVMVAKSGDRLLEEDAVEALKQLLIPISTILTPNLPEAEVLLPGEYSPCQRAELLLGLGCKAVLLKGGHERGLIVKDTLLFKDHYADFTARRIDTNNTHGTGCTLSAAIACFLAQGYSTTMACSYATQYVFGAILSAQNQTLGKGHGPVDHLWQITSRD